MFHGAEPEPPVPSPDCWHMYLLPTEHRAPVPQIEAKVLAPSQMDLIPSLTSRESNSGP